MSTAKVEAFLARLYTDKAFFQNFLADPIGTTSREDLSPHEKQALTSISSSELILTVKSCTAKREGRRK